MLGEASRSLKVAFKGRDDLDHSKMSANSFSLSRMADDEMRFSIDNFDRLRDSRIKLLSSEKPRMETFGENLIMSGDYGEKG